MRLVCPAPAKVNLALHVGPARPDGLHPLESLVAFADVGDLLYGEAAGELTLSFAGPFGASLAADPAENLVLRAAKTLRDWAGRPHLGARLLLDKRLPLASGIGGGSADAAAALRLLNRVWALGASEADLAQIAARLGADCPVCVASRPALMRGIGEICDAADIAPMHAVLVNPGQPAPTGQVYRAFDAAMGGAAFVEGALPKTIAAPQELAALRNDLEAAAVRVAPAIATAGDLLRAAPEAALVRMSGSGATVFALTADREAALRLAARIAQARPDWWVEPARLGEIDASPRPD